MKEKIKRMLPSWFVERFDKYKIIKQNSEFQGRPIEKVFTEIFNSKR
jgi:hypothetical protein